MPHVTGHFCVCHVELWLLFHDFFPVPGYLDLDLWYLGIWVYPKTNFFGVPEKSWRYGKIS